MKKRRFIKKVTATALTFALAVTTLTGCGGGDDTDSQKKAAEGSKHGGPYEETITIDVFDGLANFQGKQSGWFAKVVKDKFNMELNIIAPNVAGGGDTLFQTRSANGNLGDLIITNLDQSRLKDLVQAELVLDMKDYIKDCENLNQYKKAYEEASKLAEKDGVWAIPSEVSNQKASEPCDANEATNSPSLRWDIYKALGYPQISNLDGLLDVLRKMQEKNPKSDSGKKTYALSLFKDWDSDVMQNATGLCALYGYQNVGFCMAKVDGTDIQSDIDDDSIYIKSLKFLFDANQMGIVDPESTTQDYDTMANKYKDGQILYSLWPWLGAGQYNTEKNTSKGKGFATAIVDDMQCLTYGSMPYGKMGCGIMIGSKAQDPQRMADFIDWLYSPEGVEMGSVIQSNACGPEGLTWEMKDNKPVLTEFGDKAFVTKEENLKVPDDWGGGTWTEGNSALNYKALGLVDTNPENDMYYTYLRWEDYQNKTATELSKDWSEHNDGAATAIERLNSTGKLLVLPGTNYAMPEYSTDISAIKEQCKQTIIEYSWKMVFAKDAAEFDSLLKEMQTTVKGLGYDQVLEVDKQNCQDQYKAFDEALAAE